MQTTEITETTGTTGTTGTAAPGRDPAGDALAAGRIVLGVLGLAAPAAQARALGVIPRPEITYLTRVFAGRAIALGAGYLTEPAAQRPRWQRLGLVVDVTDTLAAAVHLHRGDVPRPAVLALGGLTACYAVTGAASLLRRRRRAADQIGAGSRPARCAAQ